MTNKLHNKVVSLLKEVGEFQLKHFRNLTAEVVDMKAAKETVSFVDVESEKMLRDGLSGVLPEAGFFGEELGQSGSNELMWIVDPIDGTTNFLSGIDCFSISVALVQKGEPNYGIVYRPYIDEYLSASRGEGILKNGVSYAPLHRGLTAKDVLFATGFPYRSEDLNDVFFKTANEVLRLGRGIRRTGSAAIDLAHLGVGWYGGFWESDLQPYDVAGAMVILREAGVLMTNHQGEPYNMFEDRLLVAAQPVIHSKLLEIISKNYKGVV